jgi:hypothetical protein
MNARRTISAVMAALGLLAAATTGNALSGAPRAVASSTPNGITGVVIDEQGTTNYDFESQSAVNTNVDWPVNLIFYNNATIDGVKFQLDNYYGYKSPEEKKMAIYQYGLTQWDGDGGKKGILCPIADQWTRHYRIYASSSDDTLYSPSLGYWVVASTHKDRGECPPINKLFYDSEEVEEHIAGLYSTAGYNVWDDYTGWYNPEPYRVEGNHVWNSNGLATFIDIFSCPQCRPQLK